jgi:hypothetical protein
LRCRSDNVSDAIWSEKAAGTATVQGDTVPCDTTGSHCNYNDLGCHCNYNAVYNAIFWNVDITRYRVACCVHSCDI